MATVVTKAVGGTAKPVGVLYIEPDLQVADAGAGTALEQTGLDPPFTADLLSACLAHERCGVHLYRSVAGRTTIEALRERYEHYGAETLTHVEKLEALISATGGDPNYVSPAARATEKAAGALLEGTYLLAGSVDPHTAELSMLEAVTLAEAKDHANWELLSELAAVMAEGDVRTQLETVSAEVLAQEEEHYGWARDARARMLYSMATGGAEPPAGDVSSATDEAIDLTELTRDELYATASELEIEGRSQMNKDELATAVAERTGAQR